MKNLVCTLNIQMPPKETKDNSYAKYSDPKLISSYTLPKMADYADKVGADFFIHTDLMNYEDPNFAKFEIANLLEKYDRVLFVDLDVVISDDAPNLFDIVPSDKLGVYLEGEAVPERLVQTEYIWNLNNFKNDGCKFMFNAGVMLFSQCHKDTIRPLPEGVKESDMKRFQEQVWFNYIFRNSSIFKLDHAFNHMDLSGKPEENIYFRHYAGSDRKKLLDIIKNSKGE